MFFNNFKWLALNPELLHIIFFYTAFVVFTMPATLHIAPHCVGNLYSMWKKTKKPAG